MRMRLSLSDQMLKGTIRGEEWIVIYAEAKIDPGAFGTWG